MGISDSSINLSFVFELHTDGRRIGKCICKLGDHEREVDDIVRIERTMPAIPSMIFLNWAHAFFQKTCRIIALNFLPIRVALRNVAEHAAQQLPIIFLHTKF